MAAGLEQYSGPGQVTVLFQRKDDATVRSAETVPGIAPVREIARELAALLGFAPRVWLNSYLNDVLVGTSDSFNSAGITDNDVLEVELR